MTLSSIEPEPSLAHAKDDFPLLRSGGGSTSLAYLDNAATTHKPSCVLAAEESFYRTANGNPHRSGHRLGCAATDAYEQARAAVARFVGAAADELVFTSGATHALNLAAHGLGDSLLVPGDEIVLSLFEHHSNLVPWQVEAKRAKAKLRYLVPDAEGCISDEEIDRVIGPRTRIVAVAHVSNVLGSVLPVEHIVRSAHAQGAVVVLDCAQSVGHLPVDIKALGVDLAAFSGHKMYGPMGIGALYGRKEVFAAMRPLMQGGGMIEDVFEASSTYAGAPYGFEAGTQNVAGAVGLAAAVAYVEGLGIERIRNHERALAKRLIKGLEACPAAKLYGVSHALKEERIGIVAFNVKGIEAADAAFALDRRGVAVRAGAHCAMPLVRHLDVRTVCRASLALYNDERDVDAFLDAVSLAREDVVAEMSASMF